MDSGRLIFDAGSHCNMLRMGSSDGVFRVVGSRSVLGMEETLRSRPFYSSHEELMEEEYYDEQLPEKKRRLSPEQVHMLERSFETENKLEPERKTELAKKLGLQPRQVAVWFQNRRARWKTKQLERDFDLLKSSYDSLVSDYDLALQENEKLKSEVDSLTEKLQAKENSGQLPAATLKAEPGGAPGEDLTSSGSGGSAVFDESPQQVIDSGDSYYPQDYPGCIAPSIDGVQSEEDDGGGGNGNDDNGYYFSDVFTAATSDDAEHHPHEQEQQFGWWVWS